MPGRKNDADEITLWMLLEQFEKAIEGTKMERKLIDAARKVLVPVLFRDDGEPDLDDEGMVKTTTINEAAALYGIEPYYVRRAVRRIEVRYLQYCRESKQFPGWATLTPALWKALRQVQLEKLQADAEAGKAKPKRRRKPKV